MPCPLASSSSELDPRIYLRCKSIGALSVFFVILILTNVTATGLVSISTLSMFFIIFPITYVTAATRPRISALPVFLLSFHSPTYLHRRHKCKCRRNYAKWRKDPLDKNCHLKDLSQERFEEGYWLMMQY